VTSGGGCLLPLHSPIARTVNFREDLPHICSESVRVTHPRQRFQIPNSPCMRSWVLSVLRMGLSRSLDIFGFSSLHLLLFRFRCQTYHKKFDLERLSWMSSQPIRFSWQSVVVLRLWFSGNWFSLLYARFPDPSRPGSRTSGVLSRRLRGILIERMSNGTVDMALRCGLDPIPSASAIRTSSEPFTPRKMLGQR
jgi:hypothetical protein